MPEYVPFEVEVGARAGDAYPVTAEFQGASWSESIPADFPLLTDQELTQALEWVERGFIDRNYARDFGGRLFDTLFDGPVRQGFRAAYERVAPEAGLRIVLRLPDDLADMPWELMYDAEGGHGFLARSTTAPLVRHMAGMPLSHEVPEAAPLRVLLVTASPAGYAPVSSEAEEAAVVSSLGRQTKLLDRLRVVVGELRHVRSLRRLKLRLRRGDLVQVEAVNHATRPAIQHRMVEARNADRGYHVVHFVGHGIAGQAGGQLLLETDDGQPDPVPADEFAELIDESTVNLVLLNACQTAAPVRLFRGVAQAVLRRGVPAVIGMQVPILDRAAVVFAREFYTAWAAGEPIESALAYARRLITQTSPGAAADWSIPVLHMAPIEGLRLPGELPPLRLPRPVRSLRWAVGAMMSILTALMLFLQVPDVARAVRTQVPVVKCVWPYPMSSEFNIAIAPFTVVDENGQPERRGDGLDLANWMYGRINTAFEELDFGVPHQLRSPGQLCAVGGANDEERQAAAAELAHRLGAHVLIYGLITDAGERSQLTPKFYVHYRGFERVEEITAGDHPFGRPLNEPLPFDQARYEGNPRAPLPARTRALSLIVVGLSYYSTANYDTALDYFQQAESTPGWTSTAGKEIAYLLLGQATGMLASQKQDRSYLPRAEAHYDAALRIRPEYPRAQLGKAGIIYREALGDPTDPDFKGLDLARLDEAEALLRQILTEDDVAHDADIVARIHLSLGQIHLARATQLGAGWLDEARHEFEQIVELYESGNPGEANLAGHAHARLGRIAWLQDDLTTAAGHYRQAAELVASPYDRTRYYTWLGDVERLAGNVDAACTAYDEAIRTAEFYGYEDLLGELQQPHRQLDCS